MKIKYSIGILCFTLFGLGACLDDQSSLGDRELSEITISAPHDTLTAYFGEEFVVSHLSVEQSGEELPLAYEWSYGTLNTDEDGMASYPIKDSLHIVSHDPELKYAFRELGTFGLRLRVDNGETIRYKYFVLQVDTEFSEGITILSRDGDGKGRPGMGLPACRCQISGACPPSLWRTPANGMAMPGDLGRRTIY